MRTSNEGGLISVGRPGSRGAPQTVSALKALSFEFEIFRHSEAGIPNGRIPCPLCKFSIPNRQFSQLMRPLHSKLRAFKSEINRFLCCCHALIGKTHYFPL